MKIRESLNNYIRILSIAKKADKGELMDTIRITGIGIGVIGLIGFMFYLVSLFIGGL